MREINRSDQDMSGCFAFSILIMLVAISFALGALITFVWTKTW